MIEIHFQTPPQLNCERQNDAPAEGRDEFFGASSCYLVEIILRQKNPAKKLFCGEMIAHNTATC